MRYIFIKEDCLIKNYISIFKNTINTNYLTKDDINNININGEKLNIDDMIFFIHHAKEKFIQYIGQNNAIDNSDQIKSNIKYSFDKIQNAYNV